MSFKRSSSEFRKKARDKLSKIGDSAGKRQVNAGGEGLDRSSLSLQPGPVTVTKDDLRKGTRIDVGKGDPRPDNSRSGSQSLVEEKREPRKSDSESDWKDTASSAAKLFLRAVERSSEAFPLLKSVAAGLELCKSARSGRVTIYNCYVGE